MENFAGNYITETIKYFCFMLSAHFAMIPDRHYSERTFFAVNLLRTFPYCYLPKEGMGYIIYI